LEKLVGLVWLSQLAQDFKKKCHRSNQNSTSQTSPLSSASHGKYLMAKGKKKEPMNDESEKEEEDDEYDLDFDKLR
jgi:hypothetical protein